MKKINSKTRTLIILIVAVIGVGLGVTYFLKGKAKSTQQQETKASSVPTISTIPGGVISEKYQNLQEEENKRKASEAKKTGGSSVATIIGNKKNSNELFGIEGQLTQCVPATTPTTLDAAMLDKLKMAKNLALTDPAAFKKLMLSDLNLAAQLAKDDPALFKKMLLADPECPTELAEKRPDIIKDLMKNDADFADAFAKKCPAIVKTLMKNDSAFARILAKNNPGLVKELMINDPEFAKIMAANNPDMVKELMQNDPEFAKQLLEKNPSLQTILAPNGPRLTIDQQRLQALDEARRKQQEKQEQAARESQLNELQAQQLAAILANMDSQSKAMFQAWNEIPAQAAVEGEWAEKEKDKGKSKPGAASGVIVKTSGGPGGAVIAAGPVIVKAGTVLFAILDTAVDSDEPGPILGTIVSGPFKGGKILGTMGFAPPAVGAGLEAVTLTFNTLSLPNKPNSIAINAVAVDADTSRTALADDVDHHYLLRYGTLFASAFMAGYAKVITSQGTTAEVATNGLVTTVRTPTLSNRQTVLAALGEVGKKWGEAVAGYFNRPNTVTIESGAGFGLLFLADVPG